MITMKHAASIVAVISLALFAAAFIFFGYRGLYVTARGGNMPVRIKLPAPSVSGRVSVEEALAKRRSVRSYADLPISLADLSQLLWSAQGVTARHSFRTAPSAGALYPLEVYVAAGNVEGLDPGVYRYNPHAHELALVRGGDARIELARAALGQSCVRDGAAVIIIAAVYARVTVKYHERGVRYVHMEAGHAAQNICLQACALGCGTVVVGAFNDGAVKKAAGMAADEELLSILPVGRM